MIQICLDYPPTSFRRFWVGFPWLVLFQWVIFYIRLSSIVKELFQALYLIETLGRRQSLLIGSVLEGVSILLECFEWYLF